MPFLRYLRTFTASLLHLHLLFLSLSHASSSSPSSAFMIFLLASFANFRSSNFRGKNYVFQSDFKVIGRRQRGEAKERDREGIEVNRSHAPIPKKRFEIAPNGGRALIGSLNQLDLNSIWTKVPPCEFTPNRGRCCCLTWRTLCIPFSFSIFVYFIFNLFYFFIQKDSSDLCRYKYSSV